MFRIAGDIMNISKISKEKIMEQACLIVKEKGIQFLSIRNLATRCKVSVGSIYNYYPTKSELVIAVIEDFWSHAYTHEDLRKVSLDDFFASYLKLYQTIYSYLQQFDGNWMHQLAALDQDMKELGRRLEHDYFQDIKKMLSIMLEKDQCIRKNQWSQVFTKQEFIDFLFDNTLLELQKGNEQPTFFLEVLKKILL